MTRAPDEPPKPEVISPEDWDRMTKDEKWTSVYVEGFQSPLLPPEILKRYGNVVPGLDKKLVEWSENETLHRRKLEIAAFEEARELRSRASILGPGVSVVGIVVSAVLSYSNPTWAGATVACVIAIVSVGGPFAARLLANRWNFKGDE